MVKITNNFEMSLPMAVWLLYDNYDYVAEDNYISATSLLKSTKQIILSNRVPNDVKEVDVTDFLSQRFGSAVHDSQEKAWRYNGRKAMAQLGYPEHIYSNIIVNPTPEQIEVNPNVIPIWIERRSTKTVTINGVDWKISGKFDTVIDGRLFDTKTTSVYSYLKRSKDDDYSMQGGIYRWLNPDIINSDHIYIQFIFTDWQRAQAKQNPDYPRHKAMEYPVLMPSNEEVDLFIKSKITELIRYNQSPENEIPPCTDKELWRSEPSYRYYSDPEKAKDPNARSSKNFDTLMEAKAFANEKGKGVVITKLGEPKACEYCAAFKICRQKDAYFAE